MEKQTMPVLVTKHMNRDGRPGDPAQVPHNIPVRESLTQWRALPPQPILFDSSVPILFVGRSLPGMLPFPPSLLFRPPPFADGENQRVEPGPPTNVELVVIVAALGVIARAVGRLDFQIELVALPEEILVFILFIVLFIIPEMVVTASPAFVRLGVVG